MSRRRPTICADIVVRASASPSETATSTAAPPETEEVELYFAVSHPTDIDLIPETHELEVESDGDVLEDALAAITEGTIAPTDPDYANTKTFTVSGT